MDAWLQLFKRFEPFVPATLENHVERPYTGALRALRGHLTFPSGLVRAAVVGTVGTGKTSELHHLVATTRLHRVVYVDLESHLKTVVADIEALNRAAPWEILALVGMAALRAGEAFGFDLAERRAAVAAAVAKLSGQDPTALSLDFPGLVQTVLVSVADAGSAAVPGLGLLKPLAAMADKVAWSIPIGREDRPAAPTDGDPDVRRLLAEVNRVLAEIAHVSAKVVLLIDGLDRITSHEQAHRLLYESSLLASLDAHTVLTVPGWLRLAASQPGGVFKFTTYHLEEVPVVDPDDWTRLGEKGQVFFQDLWTKRVGAGSQLSALIPAAEVDLLAYYSGGRVREFMHFVQDVARRCYAAGLSSANTEIVSDVLDEHRKNTTELGLDRGHIAVLEAVRDDPQHRLPDGDKVEDLVRTWRLMPYPNESTWWFPHPLLLRGLLRPRGGRAR